MIRVCVQCGKEFESASKIALVCSYECRKARNRERKRAERRKTEPKALKVIKALDVYSTWLANFEKLKPNDMLTRKAMIAKALNVTYGQIQGADDKELKRLEKKAIKAMQKGAVACAQKRKKQQP